MVRDPLTRCSWFECSNENAVMLNLLKENFVTHKNLTLLD